MPLLIILLRKKDGPKLSATASPLSTVFQNSVSIFTAWYFLAEKMSSKKAFKCTLVAPDMSLLI